MIIVRHVVLSDDIADEQFVCDLIKCKGACCVEGDLGAPLEEPEKAQLEQALPHVKPYLSEAGLREIDKQGPYLLDEDGDFSTPTINGKECAYAIYDDRGILKCGIEQAYLDGKTDFQKPISCHLYPIRITKYDEFEAVNYHRWHICDDACHNGQALGVPVYKFLKSALVRRYGQEWYNELEAEIQQKKKQGMLKRKRK